MKTTGFARAAKVLFYATLILILSFWIGFFAFKDFTQRLMSRALDVASKIKRQCFFEE